MYIIILRSRATEDGNLPLETENSTHPGPTHEVIDGADHQEEEESMRKKQLIAAAGVLALAVALGLPPCAGAASPDQLPSKADQSCLKCHADFEKTPNILAGRIVDVAGKSKSLQLQIGKDMEVIYFDDDTVLKNAPTFKEIPKQEAAKVTYYKKNGKNVAKEVEIKKGLDVPPEELASVEEVGALVAKGPEKGKYVLIDSRPGNLYDEGHIPTAVSMPFFAFDKMQEKVLPKDKETLQIYYCAGLSCVLSPLSAKKAEKLGYKNIKIFRAGLPAWEKAGNPVVSNAAGLEAFEKEGASYVLIDLRPGNVVEKGHIPKAVGVPAGGLDAMKDQFPKFKGAAIVLYTQHGDAKSAVEAYKKIAEWGYTHVSILSGGFDAWEKAGKTVAKGPAESKIAYVRKLKPGEMDVEVFKALVLKPSADIMILDVRTPAEAAGGLLPNAKNIPQEDLENHISELPKDKKIVAHCSTGIRAEMAYNVLKKAGLNAGYVKAKVEIPKDKPGEYSITE